MDGELPEAAACGRCGTDVHPRIRLWRCWWCGEFLCQDCWEDPSHCGHPEADKANRDSADTDYDGREEILKRRPGKPTEH